MPDYEPGEVVVITVIEPMAKVLFRRPFRCGCGSEVYHCALVDTGEHVDLCSKDMRRRTN